MISQNNFSNTTESVNFKIKNAKNKKHFSFTSIIRLIFGIIFVLGTCVGIGLSIPKTISDFTSQGDFTHSYDFRIKLNTNNEQTADEKLATIKNSANTLSNYLKQHGVNHYDTKYEFYNDTNDGYLSVNLPNQQVESKLKSDEGKKIDNDPFLSFFQNVIDTNKTLVYKWWGINSDVKKDNKDFEEVYSVLKFEDIFDINSPDTKVISNSDGKNGIVWRLSKQNTTLLQNIYLDMFHFAKAKESTSVKGNIDEKCWPQLLIINNFEGFINKMNYHLMRYGLSQSNDGQAYEYQQIYDNQNDYHNFTVSVYNDTEKTCYLKDAKYFLANESETIKKQQFTKDYDFKCGDLFRFVNTSNYIKYSWFSEYIDKVFDHTNYQNFFPKKITDIYENTINDDDIDLVQLDAYLTDEEANSPIQLNYVWQEIDTLENSRKYLNDYKNFKWDLPQMIFSYDQAKDLDAKITMDDFYSFVGNAKKTPIFSTPILFNWNSIETIVFIGFIVFLVSLLILLACLYKVFGLLGWLCMVFALSITSLLLICFANILFSLSFLIGLYCLSIAGTLLIGGICERLKRQAKNGYEIGLYVTKGFGKSISHSIDIAIVTLLFGVLFTYISTSTLMPLGAILILGSMFIFFSCFGLNFLINFLLFGDITMPNIWKWVFKPTFELSSHAANVFGDGNFNFDYYCKKINSLKLQIFSKRSFIALAILIVVLVAGWTCFGIFGFLSPTLFSQNYALLSTKELTDLSNVTSQTQLNNYWEYLLSAPLSLDELKTLAQRNSLELGSSLIYQSVLSKSNLDVTLRSWFVIAIATLSVSFYLALRHNWTAFVPAIVTNTIALTTFVAINAICFIKFDQISILGLIVTMFISNITIACHVNFVNSSWKRHSTYSSFEFKHLINTTLKNSWWLWMTTVVSVGIFAICFVISCPNQTWWLSIVILLGLVVIIFVVPWAISYLLYWSLLWRNSWIGAHSKKERINYDLIDEQEIEGINCFTNR